MAKHTHNMKLIKFELTESKLTELLIEFRTLWKEFQLTMVDKLGYICTDGRKFEAVMKVLMFPQNGNANPTFGFDEEQMFLMNSFTNGNLSMFSLFYQNIDSFTCFFYKEIDPKFLEIFKREADVEYYAVTRNNPNDFAPIVEILEEVLEMCEYNEKHIVKERLSCIRIMEDFRMKSSLISSQISREIEVNAIKVTENIEKAKQVMLAFKFERYYEGEVNKHNAMIEEYELLSRFFTRQIDN